MVRCYSCFGENRDDFTVCAHCGRKRITEPREPVHLQPGTQLQNGRYIIGEAVGAGGFGVVYAAWDSKLNNTVAIKEFFASQLMTRAVGQTCVIVSQKHRAEFDYRKKRFLAEARTMARFQNHRSIVNVFEYFEENDTAYFSMELLQGMALNEYLSQNDGQIDKDFALYITAEVAKALISLHKEGIIHRDVAPDNIFICNGQEIQIKLLDVGAARLADETDAGIDTVLKPGYSPAEQYDMNNRDIGPWMDVYALGATLYAMLTGIRPDEATNRKIKDDTVPVRELNPAISENLSNTVMKAIAVHKHMRFRNVQEFLDALNGQRKVYSQKVERRRRRFRWLGGITAACLAVAIGGVICLHTFSDKRAEGVLEPAEITVWYAAEEGADEHKAMEVVREDFERAYPDVTLALESFPEKEYGEMLAEAADKGELPDLFESTGAPEAVLEKCEGLENVMETEQFANCLFLDQYAGYYGDTKQMPLAIEVPLAYVITHGDTSAAYEEAFFEDLASFGKKVKIAADDRYAAIVEKNFGAGPFADKSEFLKVKKNTSPVLLSTTSAMNEVRQTLVNYEKAFVYYQAKEIHCGFTYEWSICPGEKNERAAAERLLSWMLGNVYQTTLMITECSDGQLPVHPTCFQAKTKIRNLKPISEIYKQFVFEREEGQQ